MQVAFYKGKGKFLDRAIKWWTAGEYSHVELVFPSGMCFSSSFMDGGCRFKQIDLTTGRWVVVDVEDGLYDPVIRVGMWCDHQKGKKYDYLGIFGFILTPFRNKMQTKKKWYCSEVVAEALRRLNPEKYGMLPEKLSPSDLKAWLKVLEMMPKEGV